MVSCLNAKLASKLLGRVRANSMQWLLNWAAESSHVSHMMPKTAGWAIHLVRADACELAERGGRVTGICAQAVELLTKVQGAHTREIELIRAVTEMDAINAMLGNVKMAMPGLHQVQNKARQAKKKK